MGKGQGNEMMIKWENSCNLCFLITPFAPIPLPFPLLSLTVSVSLSLSLSLWFCVSLFVCLSVFVSLALSVHLLLNTYIHTHTHTHTDGERETWAVFFKFIFIEIQGSINHSLQHTLGIYVVEICMKLWVLDFVMLMTASFMKDIFFHKEYYIDSSFFTNMLTWKQIFTVGWFC